MSKAHYVEMDELAPHTPTQPHLSSRRPATACKPCTLSPIIGKHGAGASEHSEEVAVGGRQTCTSALPAAGCQLSVGDHARISNAHRWLKSEIRNSRRPGAPIEIRNTYFDFATSIARRILNFVFRARAESPTFAIRFRVKYEVQSSIWGEVRNTDFAFRVSFPV